MLKTPKYSAFFCAQTGVAMIRFLRHAMMMHTFTHKIYLLFVVLIPTALFFVAYYFYTPAPKSLCAGNSIPNTQVLSESGLLNVSSTTIISVEIARTPDEHKRGLSGRSKMNPFSGMFFVFNHADTYGFWMPDMCFAIDIIWVNADWQVVHIAHNVTPESYPNVFTPDTPALYVLEVKSGMADAWGLKVGTVITFLNPLSK